MKKGQQEKRSEAVSVRLTPTTKQAGKKVAHATGRTLSGLIEFAFATYINDHFPEAFDKKTAVVAVIK